MKQIPPQNKARTEMFPRHEPLPSPPDARHGLERVKTGHEINLNRDFHKTEPMQALWWCFQVCVELPTPKHDQIEKWFRSFAETGEFGSDVLYRAVLEHHQSRPVWQAGGGIGKAVSSRSKLAWWGNQVGRLRNDS